MFWSLLICSSYMLGLGDKIKYHDILDQNSRDDYWYFNKIWMQWHFWWIFISIVDVTIKWVKARIRTSLVIYMYIYIIYSNLQAKMANISCSERLELKDSLLFFIMHHITWRVFGFWTAGWTNEAAGRRHCGEHSPLFFDIVLSKWWLMNMISRSISKENNHWSQANLWGQGNCEEYFSFVYLFTF